MVGRCVGGGASTALHCTLLPPSDRMTDDPTEDWAVREQRHSHSHQVRQINSRCRRGSRHDANRNFWTGNAKSRRRLT